MADIKINTAAVTRAANSINALNGQMRDLMPALQNAVNNLDNAWDSPAATAGIGKFREIKSEYADGRYKVINNYVNFLLQQVGSGYEQTESANKSLADAFK